MGYHPAAVRLFAEWSYRRLLKCGVKFSAPPYRTAAADAQSVSEATNVLQEWRQFGRSMTMQNSGDGALAAYDGMRSAARINLHEMQREQRAGLVARAKYVLAIMTLCPPVNTPVELFLGSHHGRQRAAIASESDDVPSQPAPTCHSGVREAISVLEQHALLEVDGDQLGMHQLMARAVRDELTAEAPGVCAGVEGLQALLTARYGTEEDIDVEADEYVAMRLMGECAEYAVAEAAKAAGSGDVGLQRWACGMYLRLARVQLVVTSDAASCERLLCAGRGCLQRLEGQGCDDVQQLEWRMRLYEASALGDKGDFDAKLSVLQSLEKEFTQINVLGHCVFQRRVIEA
jgi:hypothetical protein